MSIQGHILDFTVVGCQNLKNTEWISKQDPYVIIEYGSTRYRTKTDTDGGKNPTFNEKYMIPLIEGLREINLSVYNSNTFSPDEFIGSGKVILQTVLSDGYHDSTWALTRRSGKRAGEIRVIMHYQKPVKKPTSSTSESSVNPTYFSMNPYPPPASAPPMYLAQPTYPPPPTYPAPLTYPPPGYAPPVYPSSAYPPMPPYPSTGYHPPAYPEGYPPQGYPPSVFPDGYPPPGYPRQGYYPY